jgi:predicted PurR-regulated permease PerM
MNSIFLFFLTAYIIYYLFRPVTKKEIEKFENPDNWSNMGL